MTRPGLNTDSAEAHFNQGKMLREQGKLHEAELCLLNAIRIKPEFIAAYNILGNVLADQNRSDAALSCYHRALEINPGLPEACFNSANILIAQKRPDEAINYFHRAISIKPNFAEAFFGIGKACYIKGLLEDALSNYQYAISIRPDFAEAYNELGNIYRRMAKLEDSIACYYKALTLRPDFGEVYCNISNAMKDLGDLDAALEYCHKAMTVNPDLVIAHWNLSLILLARGEFFQGFREYEWRLKRPEFAYLNSKMPVWSGEHIPEKTILIRAEQGLGDTIQFVRFLPLVRKYAGRVVFECPGTLMGLLDGLDGIDSIVKTRPDRSIPEIPFDTWAPLMSLPWILRATIKDIPQKIPYICAEPEKTANWKRRINGAGMKVGIVWAGSPDHENDRNRSCRLNHFLPLANISGIRLYGLQKDRPVRQADIHPWKAGFVNFDAELADFRETAGAIENTDLIITVDTAVAHLAGAMGKPVWVLLPFSPDWRWMLNREDTPWYPTMRLFRQKRPGNWGDVFSSISEKLTEILQK